jgi:cysteinyl-tRNA synthetase
MNITDVDDKTIRDSQKEGVKLKDFTRKYETAFYEDLKSLNILAADEYPKATDNIDEMINLIDCLLKKGLAYKGADGSTYFSISKFKDYGKLAHIRASKLKAGASGRVKSDEYTKDTVQDFALWKAWSESDGPVFWETKIGKGRPGWHIECSAMSMKYLGRSFDIHCGGIDLVFPHHQNEIAQSEGCTGKSFVKYWLHNDWLLVGGQKMSKSLGNFLTLRDVLQKGYSIIAVRYLLLSTHYRQQLNFTFDGVNAGKAAIDRLNELIRKLWSANGSESSISKELITAEKAFEAAMDDDLNISAALAAVFDFVKIINSRIDAGTIGKKSAGEILELLKKFDSVLGIMNFEKEEKLPAELQDLLNKRELFRKEKKWADSDKMRNLLKEKGILIDDTPFGVKWKRAG